MSYYKFKKETDEIMSNFTKNLHETNKTGTILDEIDQVAQKYDFHLEEKNIEHVDYGKNNRQKIEVLDKKEEPIGIIALNVYRNEHGTYEFNGYLSKNSKKLRY